MFPRLLPATLLLGLLTAACTAPASPTSAPTGGSWLGGIFPPAQPAGDLSGDRAKSFNAPATPAPTATPTPLPTPVASASTAPTPSPSPTSGMAAVECRVFDELGAPVDGGYIRIRSLDNDRPFDSTVGFSTAGAYRLGRIPTGVALEVEASRVDGGGDRFTRRTRRVTLAANGDGTILQFGTATGEALVPESAEFISDMPEVERVELATSQGIGEARLFLSEPLDGANRAAFATALRILPANGVADPDVGATDAASLTDLEHQPDHLASYTYAIDDPAVPNVATTWNSVGDVVTMTFPLSALRSTQRAAIYQLALVSDGTVIQDLGGAPLGMGDVSVAGTLAFGDYGANGELIYNAFKRPTLSLASGDEPARRRWGGTHMNSFLFRVDHGNLIAVAPRAYP